MTYDMTDITENPHTGERLRWHVRSADSDGRFARIELWCRPGGGVPYLHVHTVSEERFEILAGRLEVVLGGRKLEAGPGEHLVLPAGVPHCWTVAPGAEAHVFIEIDDPRGFEEQVETFYALGRRGRLGTPGRPIPLLTAACLTAPYLDLMRPVGPPLAVQRVMFAALSRLARLTGHARTVDAARAEARERLAAPRVPA